MITKQYLILVAALLIGFFTSCETMQQALNLNKPTARLVALRFQDVKLDSATLLFDVEIDNHYPVNLPLTNFDYSLSSSVNKLLSGSTNTQGSVPAKSTKSVSLPTKINYIEMLKALKGVMPGSKIPYNAEMALSVDAPGLGPIKIPLKKEGELVLPSISETTVKDIWDIIKPK